MGRAAALLLLALVHCAVCGRVPVTINHDMPTAAPELPSAQEQDPAFGGQSPYGRVHDAHRARRQGHGDSLAGYAGSASGGNCGPDEVLRVDFAAGEEGDGKLYANAFNGAFAVEEGDALEYEVMWQEADCNCSVDLEASDFRVRDRLGLDEEGYSPHAEYNGNMTRVAHKRWYHRSFSLSEAKGLYADKYVFAAAVGPGQTRTAFFRYVRIRDATGSVKRVLFEAGSAPPTAHTYFTGDVRLSCQPPAVLDAVHIVVPAATFGEPFAFGAVLTQSSVGDAADPHSSCADPLASPSASPVAVFRHLDDEASVGEGEPWRLTQLRAAISHRTVPGVVLWDLGNRTMSAPLPAPFWWTVVLPSGASPLDRLLHDADLTVTATVAQGPEERTVTAIHQPLVFK